jgi:glycerol transport system substrate-binding protein
VTRGGATNGPAAVYAIRKWDEWLRKYAPPGSCRHDFYQSCPALAKGNVAQQIFWYTAFTARMVEPGPTVNADGNPQMAHGPLAPWPLLGRRHEAGLSGRGSWTS